MALKKTQKSLKKWTKQEWDYVTKGDSKNQEENVGVTYLSLLEKVLVLVKNLTLIDKKERLLQKESREQSTVKK